MKNKLSFILSLVATLGLLALAWFKSVDIGTTLPMIVTGYVLGRSATKASYAFSLGKDPNADTREGIKDIEK